MLTIDMLKKATKLMDENSTPSLFFCEWCWDFSDTSPVKVAEHTLNHCDCFKNKKRRRLELKK